MIEKRLTHNKTVRRTTNSKYKAQSQRVFRSSRSACLGQLCRRNTKPKTKTKTKTKPKKISTSKIINLASKMANPTDNLGKMLSVACKNPDNCLELGEYAIMMKRYFEDFKNLALADTSKMHRLGVPSVNGFIFEIPFTKNNYTAYTVLKCATTSHSDNLYYEYYVGKHFINKWVRRLPCFVETYDSYVINSKEHWTQLYALAKQNGKLSVGTQLNTFISPTPASSNEWGKSCVTAKYNAVLIQHFDKAKTIKQLNDNEFDSYKYDIPAMLYQVYFALCTLGDKYTHYDLHYDNVLQYQPYGPNEYIQMRYHYTKTGKLVEFPTDTISKIIDYGRNYVNMGNKTSTDIITQVCGAKECQPDCGVNAGYFYIQGDEYDSAVYNNWIYPNKPNHSHDLRLLYMYSLLWPGFLSALNINTLKYDDYYGTPFSKPGDRENIRTIYDAHECLMHLLTSASWTSNYAKKYNSSWKKVATMDIYDDGRDYVFRVI